MKMNKLEYGLQHMHKFPGMVTACFIFSHFTLFYPDSCWFRVHFDDCMWTLDTAHVL